MSGELTYCIALKFELSVPCFTTSLPRLYASYEALSGSGRGLSPLSSHHFTSATVMLSCAEMLKFNTPLARRFLFADCAAADSDPHAPGNETSGKSRSNVGNLVFITAVGGSLSTCRYWVRVLILPKRSAKSISNLNLPEAPFMSTGTVKPPSHFSIILISRTGCAADPKIILFLSFSAPSLLRRATMETGPFSSHTVPTMDLLDINSLG